MKLRRSFTQAKRMDVDLLDWLLSILADPLLHAHKMTERFDILLRRIFRSANVTPFKVYVVVRDLMMVHLPRNYLSSSCCIEPITRWMLSINNSSKNVIKEVRVLRTSTKISPYICCRWNKQKGNVVFDI